MVRAQGAMPAREFSKNHKQAATGPVEEQSLVLTNWGRLGMGRSGARGGVDRERVNWKGLIAQPADMRLRIRRPR